MLYRKISKEIEAHLASSSDKVLVLEGARQIGKSFIIREIGKRLFKNFVEVNFAEDDEGPQHFKNIHSTEAFYFTLSMVAGNQLGNFDDTLVFLDEIQTYPQYLTMLKFFRQERRYRFIASGSLLGIALRSTTSIPVGSIIRKEMYQLDFEEFLMANNFNSEAIDGLREKFKNKESLSEEQHQHLLGLFRRYLLVGGMPDAVNVYLETHNIVKVREIQDSIKTLYGDDVSKYEQDSHIRDKAGDRFVQYQEEFEYLISSGIALDVHAVSNPRFPLSESVHKNLLKLYLNDVGMLTAQLYRNNLRPVLEDERSVNLGAVYESAVAQQLKANGHRLFYYDNRKKGEVDFLIDDYSSTSILPIEVKSGKDYSIHSALNNLLSTPDYHVKSAIVLSNDREVRQEGQVTYIPVYYALFLDAQGESGTVEF